MQEKSSASHYYISLQTKENRLKSSSIPVSLFSIALIRTNNMLQKIVALSYLTTCALHAK